MQRRPCSVRARGWAVCVAGLASLGVLVGPLAIAPTAAAETPPLSSPDRTDDRHHGRRPVTIATGASQTVGAPWPLIVVEGSDGQPVPAAFLVDFTVCAARSGEPVDECATASAHLSSAQRTFSGQTDILRRTVQVPQEYRRIWVTVRVTPLDAGVGRLRPAIGLLAWTRSWHDNDGRPHDGLLTFHARKASGTPSPSPTPSHTPSVTPKPTPEPTAPPSSVQPPPSDAPSAPEAPQPSAVASPGPLTDAGGPLPHTAAPVAVEAISTPAAPSTPPSPSPSAPANTSSRTPEGMPKHRPGPAPSTVGATTVTPAPTPAVASTPDPSVQASSSSASSPAPYSATPASRPASPAPQDRGWLGALLTSPATPIVGGGLLIAAIIVAAAPPLQFPRQH